LVMRVRATSLCCLSISWVSGAKPVAALLVEPKIRFCYLAQPPSVLRFLPFIALAPIKIVHQLLSILYTFFVEISEPPEFIIVQVRLCVRSSICDSCGAFRTRRAYPPLPSSDSSRLSEDARSSLTGITLGTPSWLSSSGTNIRWSEWPDCRSMSRASRRRYAHAVLQL
jgi:hypothetical protein